MRNAHLACFIFRNDGQQLKYPAIFPLLNGNILTENWRRDADSYVNSMSSILSY
jgi:hypothetical protein